MFTVTTKAATTGLTTLKALKIELGITNGDEDEYLKTQIDRVSRMIFSYLKVSMAEDGSVNLGRETIVETFRLHKIQGRGGYYAGGSGIAFNGNDEKPVSKLLLARRPVTAIASVVEDGVTLDAGDYEVEGAAGMLARLFADRPRDWCAQKTVVTYTAGWLLPNDDLRNLPQDIEDAAISLIKAARYSRRRDPMVKSQEIPGVMKTDWWVGGVGDEAFPAEIAGRLDPYRSILIP